MPANVTIAPAQQQQILQQPQTPTQDITPSIDIDLPAYEVVESFLQWLNTYDDGQFSNVTSLTNDIYNEIGRASTSTELSNLIAKYQYNLRYMGKRLKTAFPKVFMMVDRALNKVLGQIEAMQEQAGGIIPIKRSAKRKTAQTLSGEYKPQSQAPGTTSVSPPDTVVENPVEDVNKNLEVGDNVFPEVAQEMNQDETYKNRAKTYLTKGLDNLLKVQDKPGGLRQLTEQLMCIVRKLDKRYTRPKE